MLHVVAGIIHLDDRILICQRHHSSKRFPLKWEFPGGKVEAGESPRNAIIRELKEELGIDVSSVSEMESYTFAYPGENDFCLHFFEVEKYSNTIQNLQFENMAWLLPESIETYDLLDGDKPFIKNFLSIR